MNLVRSAYAMLLGLVVLAGCSPSSGSGSGDALRVAVIPKGSSHDFWFSVRAGAERADEELTDLTVTWKGPVSEGDDADQIEIVEQFIADGYDGICLAPLDARALRKPAELAMSNGTPVVIFDSGLDDLSDIVSYVATNNYRGGARAGEKLAELLGGEGNVILMRYQLNSQSTEEREQGFLDTIAEHDGINVISENKHAGPDESGAIRLAEDLLLNFKDDVDGIFCPNQSTASGMLTALRSAGLAGKVKFVGFDSGENIASGLAAGEMDAAVLQDPVQMGYDAVMAMHAHLKGEPVEQRIETQEVLATTENLDDEKVHALLYPAVVE